MRYSALVRKLVAASERARWNNEDIADVLKERCTADSDIIRQTLMNAVCDPRFKMHIGAVKSWRTMAVSMLERLASRLESKNILTEDIAVDEMNEILNWWIATIVNLVEQSEGKLHFVDHKEASKEDEMKDAIDNFLKSSAGGEDDDEPELVWDGVNADDSEGGVPGISEEETEQNDNMSEGKDQEEDYTDKEQDPIEQKEPNNNDKVYNPGWGWGSGSVQAIERQFLTHVPPSIIELARRIGRSSESPREPQGKFLSASKSDIAGITTGNDINCVLPSELALMANPVTENIFYKNYVTHSLQLFASASHSIKGDKHHDGPIIICLDTSSSMTGTPMTVAAAITFAICIIAQRRNRPVVVVKYSNSYDSFSLKNLEADKQPLMNFLSQAEMGGNNENAMFKWLFNELLPNDSICQNGDILCISDFGWVPIFSDVMELINRQKAKKMRFYGLNIQNDLFDNSNLLLGLPVDKSVTTKDYFGPQDVCDSLWEYSGGVCKETDKASGK